MTLGDVIAKFRDTHGISMDRFSEMSGISKTYISMLERNQTQRGEKCRLRLLKLIATPPKEWVLTLTNKEGK